MNKLTKLYEELYDLYGPQGWWPLSSGAGAYSLDDSYKVSYHPGDYTYPHNTAQQYQICLGAILTQNTNWVNVEKVILNLARSGYLSAEKISSVSSDELAELIISSGYFRQKTKKIKLFTDYFLQHRDTMPKREELLDIWGIGPETADSILLYAYKEPSFVIDAYTKRVFEEQGILKEALNYEQLKKYCETNLEKNYILYQEFHALIVKHAKNK